MNIINIDINVIATYLAAGAGGAGLGAWIFKRWAESWIEKRGKKYQQRLDSELMLKQAALDSKSQIIQNQLDEKLELVRIEYGTLYTKRLSAIEKLYEWLLYFKKVDALLERAHDPQTQTIKDISTTLTEKDKEILISFETKASEFKEYFETIELYLPTRIAECLGMFNIIFIFKLTTIIPDSFLWSEYIKKNGEVSAEDRTQITKMISEFREFYKEMTLEITMDKLIKELQNEFRKLIGADIQRK